MPTAGASAPVSSARFRFRAKSHPRTLVTPQRTLDPPKSTHADPTPKAKTLKAPQELERLTYSSRLKQTQRSADFCHISRTASFGLLSRPKRRRSLPAPYQQLSRYWHSVDFHYTPRTYVRTIVTAGEPTIPPTAGKWGPEGLLSTVCRRTFATTFRVALFIPESLTDPCHAHRGPLSRDSGLTPGLLSLLLITKHKYASNSLRDNSPR